jgi:cell division protein FtsL
VSPHVPRISRLAKRGSRTFVALWTLATVATVCAFLVHLALRGKTVSLGYELGRARAEQARLREVKRVLEVEAASYKTPERVEIVARTLLGMEPPPPERIVPLGPITESHEHAVAASEPHAGLRADSPADSPPEAHLAAEGTPP